MKNMPRSEMREGPQHRLSLKEYKELTQQFENPQHCHLMFPDGHFFAHNPNDQGDRDFPPNPLKGQPIRFTRLAAERLAPIMGASIVSAN